jgi:hypothetical protein
VLAMVLEGQLAGDHLVGRQEVGAAPREAL